MLRMEIIYIFWPPLGAGHYNDVGHDSQATSFTVLPLHIPIRSQARTYSSDFREDISELLLGILVIIVCVIHLASVLESF